MICGRTHPRLGAGCRRVAGLLAIDQFEEIFTQATTRPTVAPSSTCSPLTTAQDPQIRVVMGLRSDFYSTSAGYPWLADRISDNQMLVGPMRRHELRRAIELPAQRAGLRLEPGLAEAHSRREWRRSGHVASGAHALMETWRRRRGTVLTLEGFHNAGGVVGAIAQSAENAYKPLDESRRGGAAIVPAPGLAGRRRTRHPPPARLGGSGRRPGGLEVIETLATERLLTVDDRGVELAHETLIQPGPACANGSTRIAMT